MYAAPIIVDRATSSTQSIRPNDRESRKLLTFSEGDIDDDLIIIAHCVATDV